MFAVATKLIQGDGSEEFCFLSCFGDVVVRSGLLGK